MAAYFRVRVGPFVFSQRLGGGKYQRPTETSKPAKILLGLAFGTFVLVMSLSMGYLWWLLGALAVVGLAVGGFFLTRTMRRNDANWQVFKQASEQVIGRPKPDPKSPEFAAWQADWDKKYDKILKVAESNGYRGL